MRLSVGSSPLARGLRIGPPRALTATRIIPARAGFTTRNFRLIPVLTDHPRSRGVYETMGFSHHSVAGSSPLARGLPAVRGVEDGSIRIIPARAGFTGVGFIVRFLSGDHPRSRGVYHKDTVECIWMIGSSPLARGLRLTIRAPGETDGIIPARAGFTGYAA